MTQSGFSLSNRRWYFTILLFSWVVAAWYLVGAGKQESFLSLHPTGPTSFDGFMRNITHLGDGLFTVAVIIILLLRRQWVSASMVSIAYSTSGLLAQALKHMLGLPRPAAYFADRGIPIFTMPDLSVHLANSFPSGHATSAFALATCLAIIFRVKWLALPLLLLAWLVAYTRVYLGQHFPEDIWFGSLLGVGGALLARWIVLLLAGKYPNFRNYRFIPHG